MSRNKSFDFVAKQVFDQEGVDIGPLIYRTEDARVEAVDPITMSEEYTKLKQEYTDVSAKHTAGTSLNDREAKIVDRWNACQDRCALIASEIALNRWYFLREIMTVPENIHTSSDSPFLVDLRTDDSFPLSAWMVKAIWAWEHRIPVYCNLVPGMHVEVFLAAMYLYDLFYDSIKYIRYQLDSYRTSKIETISTSKEYWSEISFKRIEIVTLMNDCILRIMERYSYLQDICLDVLERLKLLRKSLCSAGYLGETLDSTRYMIGSVDENDEICDPGYDFHRTVPIAPKQSGIIQYCGFLSYKEFHMKIVSYPYLHFNMIMNPEINKFLEDFCKQRLTYGNIEGNPEFKAGVCKLYKTIKLDEIIPTHGATGANHHVFYSLISPGERVISIRPTYQQLNSIPESYGADVQLIDLKKENGYLPDIEEIRRLATPETKMICPLILIRFVKKCTSRQVLLSRQGTVLNSRTA